MGYVTAQDLIKKYGSTRAACVNYLIGGMTDPDDRSAVELRITPETMILARLDIIENKIDLIWKNTR